MVVSNNHSRCCGTLSAYSSWNLLISWSTCLSIAWSRVARSCPCRSLFRISQRFHHCSQIKEMTLVVQWPLNLVDCPGCVLSCVLQAHPNRPCIICSHPICSCWVPISSSAGSTGMLLVDCPSNTALSLDISSCQTSGPVSSLISFSCRSFRNFLLQVSLVAAGHRQKC